MRSGLVVFLALALGACGGGGSSPTSPSAASTPAPTPIPTPTPEPWAFAPGQYLLGTQIGAGRYFADPVAGCYWERQSGLGGTLNDVIANDFIGFDSGQCIVDILSTDLAFEADGDCGNWYATPRRGPETSVSPGTWLVGGQVAPGVYRATAAAGCYWERLRNFEGVLRSIIANDFVADGGPQLVEISATDVGFSTDDQCGTWSPVVGAATFRSVEQSRDEIEREWRRHQGAEEGRFP